MKFVLVLNLFLCLKFNINCSILNSKINAYQELKEFRYIYFYDFTYFDINNIQIYAGDKLVNYKYTYEDNMYIIDLENYFPLDCIKIESINNFNYKVKIKRTKNIDDDFFAFFYNENLNIIDISNFEVFNSIWNSTNYTTKKINNRKTIKIINW